MGLEENMQCEQQNWSEPKETVFCDFTKQVDVWIKEAHGRMEEARRIDESVRLADSVSVDKVALMA